MELQFICVRWRKKKISSQHPKTVGVDYSCIEYKISSQHLKTVGVDHSLTEYYNIYIIPCHAQNFRTALSRAFIVSSKNL